MLRSYVTLEMLLLETFTGKSNSNHGVWLILRLERNQDYS